MCKEAGWNGQVPTMGQKLSRDRIAGANERWPLQSVLVAVVDHVYVCISVPYAPLERQVRQVCHFFTYFTLYHIFTAHRMCDVAFIPIPRVYSTQNVRCGLIPIPHFTAHRCALFYINRALFSVEYHSVRPVCACMLVWVDTCILSPFVTCPQSRRSCPSTWTDAHSHTKKSHHYRAQHIFSACLHSPHTPSYAIGKNLQPLAAATYLYIIYTNIIH